MGPCLVQFTAAKTESRGALQLILSDAQCTMVTMWTGPACLGFDCRSLRCYIAMIMAQLQQAPGTLTLRQLEISVDNIATSRRARDYRPLRTSGHNLLITNGQASKVNDALEHLALHSLTDHTIALEGIYDAMLRQMDDLSTQIRTEEADLKAIQSEVESFSAPLS